MGMLKVLSLPVEKLMPAKPQTLYTEATATTLEQKLDKLAAMPKGLALRTLIERLKPKIRAAQDAGHTYEDIAKTLGESGVQITVNTLKQYLREPRQEADSCKATPRPTTTDRTTKRMPVAAATPKPEPEQTVAISDSDTEPQTDRPPALTPIATTSTTVSQPEDTPQTAPVTNTPTPQIPLTNTNRQGFQEMRSDADL